MSAGKYLWITTALDPGEPWFRGARANLQEVNFGYLGGGGPGQHQESTSLGCPSFGDMPFHPPKARGKGQVACGICFFEQKRQAVSCWVLGAGCWKLGVGRWVEPEHPIFIPQPGTFWLLSVE